MSNIEWCDETLNVSVGCSRVSTGCERCFAERFASRGISASHEGLTVTTQKGPRWTGEVRLFPERLAKPLHWRKPRRIFINSMSDLFHEGIGDDYLDQVFAMMALCPQHVFQVLTKRPERMKHYLRGIQADPEKVWAGMSRDLIVGRAAKKKDPSFPAINAPTEWNEDGSAKPRWPLPNVWLGVSCEDQEAYDERTLHLLETPAAVRFVSLEPLLGAIDPHLDDIGYRDFEGRRIDWVIVGGESGPGARPCNVDWIYSIVEQCKAAGVPVFVKQDSGPRAGKQGRIPDELWIKEMPNVS